MTRAKMVRTRLDIRLYEDLQRVADSKHMTLADAVKEAIQRWVTDGAGAERSPLFDFGVVLRRGAATDSSNDDETLYGSAGRGR